MRKNNLRSLPYSLLLSTCQVEGASVVKLVIAAKLIASILLRLVRFVVACPIEIGCS